MAAELHIIGQLLNAVDFDDSVACGRRLFCQWSCQFGANNWKCIEGAVDGRTCVSRPRLVCSGGEDDDGGGSSVTATAFAHPIDVHLACRGVQGWPRLHVEVYAVDVLDRYWPVGFGVAHVPTRPGAHRVEVNTWKVTSGVSEAGGWSSWLSCGLLAGRANCSALSGGGAAGLSLAKSDLVYSGAERYKLSTVASGRVHFDLWVVCKNFAKFGVELH